MPKNFISPTDVEQVCTLIATALTLPLTGDNPQFDSPAAMALIPDPRTRCQLHQHTLVLLHEKFVSGTNGAKYSRAKKELHGIIESLVLTFVQKNYKKMSGADQAFFMQQFSTMIDCCIENLSQHNNLFAMLQNMFLVDSTKSDVTRLVVQLDILIKSIDMIMPAKRNWFKQYPVSAKKRLKDFVEREVTDRSRRIFEINKVAAIVGCSSETDERKQIEHLNKEFSTEQCHIVLGTPGLTPLEQTFLQEMWNANIIYLMLLILQRKYVAGAADIYTKDNWRTHLMVNIVNGFMTSCVLYIILWLCFDFSYTMSRQAEITGFVLMTRVSLTLKKRLFSLHLLFDWPLPDSPTHLLITPGLDSSEEVDFLKSSFEEQRKKAQLREKSKAVSAAYATQARGELLEKYVANAGAAGDYTFSGHGTGRVIKTKGSHPPIMETSFPSFTSTNLPIKLEFINNAERYELNYIIQMNNQMTHPTYIVAPLTKQPGNLQPNYSFGVFANENMLSMKVVKDHPNIKLASRYLLFIPSLILGLPDELISIADHILARGNYVPSASSHSQCITSIEATDVPLNTYYQQGYRFKLHYKHIVHGNSRILGRVIESTTFSTEDSANLTDNFLGRCKLILFDRFVPNAH